MKVKNCFNYLIDYSYSSDLNCTISPNVVTIIAFDLSDLTSISINFAKFCLFRIDQKKVQF